MSRRKKIRKIKMYTQAGSGIPLLLHHSTHFPRFAIQHTLGTSLSSTISCWRQYRCVTSAALLPTTPASISLHAIMPYGLHRHLACQTQICIFVPVVSSSSCDQTALLRLLASTELLKSFQAVWGQPAGSELQALELSTFSQTFLCTKSKFSE